MMEWGGGVSWCLAPTAGEVVGPGVGGAGWAGHAVEASEARSGLEELQGAAQPDRMQG